MNQKHKDQISSEICMLMLFFLKKNESKDILGKKYLGTSSSPLMMSLSHPLQMPNAARLYLLLSYLLSLFPLLPIS